MQIRQIIPLLLLLLIAVTVFALSTDEAIAVVTTKNNYLMNGESANAIKNPITYNNQKYIMVAAQKGDSVTCYIPVKVLDGNIATKDIEVRETVKTAIIYTKMLQLKDSTTPADWLLSYSAKNKFFGLQNDFSQMVGSVLTVKTELDKLGIIATDLSKTATETKTQLETIATASKDLADEIDLGMQKETNYFSTPDASQNASYQIAYTKLFSAIDDYRTKWGALQTNITKLNQGIGALQTNQLTIDQKRSLQALLSTPTSTRSLDSFFGTTDQIRTLIERAFDSAKESDTLASTLTTRRAKSEAWLVLYGPNPAMQKLDQSFTTLEATANAILSTENIDQWSDTDSVTALKSNWNAAVARFNNLEYDKAKEYANKAQNNAKQVMLAGAKKTEDTVNQDLVIKVIVGLVIILIIVFAYENFIVKKKKPEEEYNEP
jgi:hypothetical protein